MYFQERKYLKTAFWPKTNNPKHPGLINKEVLKQETESAHLTAVHTSNHLANYCKHLMVFQDALEP